MNNYHMTYAGRTVLITGGAGFIGSHLAEACVMHGAQVRILDNFSTGLHSSLETIKTQVTLMEGTVTDLNMCLEATKECDIIFHLAAETSVPRSIEFPYDCFYTNVVGTLTLLEAARANSVSTVIFSSSAAVYGPQEGICSETTVCQPTSPYGSSKLMGELLCKQYSTLYGIRTACLRYFNVYGARQRHDVAHAGIVTKLMHAMQHNQPITVYGDGYQSRDFVPVEQVIAANLWFGAHASSSWCAEPYNIATGKSMSLRELIQKLHCQFPGYDLSQIQFTDARPGDVRHSAADCAKFVRSQMGSECNQP